MIFIEQKNMRDFDLEEILIIIINPKTWQIIGSQGKTYLSILIEVFFDFVLIVINPQVSHVKKRHRLCPKKSCI